MFSKLLLKVLILVKAAPPKKKMRMPSAFSILFANVLILVEAFMNLKAKLEDAFSVFNTFSESSDFTRRCLNFLQKL